ncbi:MAG: sigma-70 family RNA polymerase sigma factor [Elainella sp. C42_A2020_010]|nr:sigma-70 family RNA polymerase sigma factor [Elainella sp. C42_A2020_010]RNJ68008.1 MAG: sigma-70 family RNA polymerase sigma factor [Leptolyngbya sp. IPPAS B-1204]
MIITTQRKRAAPKAGKVPFTHKTARRSIPEPEITLDSSKVDLSQQSGLSPVEPTAVIPVLESEPELGIDDGLLDSVDVQFTAANKADSTYLGDAVRQYLVAIGKFPLLTAEQEIVYGRQIEQGQVLLAAQQRAQEKFGLGDTLPTLEQWAEAAEATPEQVQRTMKAYQQAVDKLVVHNLRLVVAVAKKYLNKSKRLDFLDLIQEGTVGLRRGAEKFEISKGYKFSTYAYWWIRQGITRAIAEQDNMIRLPIHISEKYNKLRRSRAILTGQLGHAPTLAEVAEASGIDETKAKNIIESVKSNATASLSHRVGKDEDRELGDLIADEHHQSPDSMLDAMTQQEMVADLLSELKEKERQVIILRFGLDDGTARSLQEVGNILNLSRERVRQIERNAMTRLKSLTKTKKVSIDLVF